MDHEKLDHQKQNQYALLAEELSKRLGTRYEHQFTWFQGKNAYRIVLQSEPSNPFYEVAFSNEEALFVSVSVPGRVNIFTAHVQLSHCVSKSDGWSFDIDAIELAAVQLIDLGRRFWAEQKLARSN